MYGMRLRLPDSGLLRATCQFLINMFQAAFNCDFYITKYQAKPMQQMQNLLGTIRGGLERLEREEEELGIGTKTAMNKRRESSPRDLARGDGGEQEFMVLMLRGGFFSACWGSCEKVICTQT